MIFKDGTLAPTEPAVELVHLLSRGTYTTFPQALKEFVSNSFDADAQRVDIKIDEDGNGITIRDNGEGMTLNDFGTAFASIARSGATARGVKRGRTRSGRVKIGRFGIGSLALVAICNRFVVRSTKGGSAEGFVASMDVAKLRDHFGKGENLSDCWKFQAEKWGSERSTTHFTEIRLEGLAPEIRSLLERPGEKRLTEGDFESISQLSGFDQLAWHLGNICPVPYAGGYPIPQADVDLARDALLVEKSRRLIRDRFRVYLDGSEVRRHVMLPKYKRTKRTNAAEQAYLLERGLGYEVRGFRSRRGSPVRYEGYAIVQAKQLVPQELRGILVRLRGVAIGGYGSFHLTGGSISTMLPALSGEIWVDAGLDDALQFDRESFREDHPNFQLFRERVTEEIEAESKRFRARSARRTEMAKQAKARGKPTSSPGEKPKTTTDARQPQQSSVIPNVFIDPDIFKECPTFISYLIPQINGCWDRQWYEACALMCRRLLESLTIFVYENRGWKSAIYDGHEYLSLKNLIDKVCGDGRIGLGQKTREGLLSLREFGGVAAHDFRVRVRRGDLAKSQDKFRLASERLVFIALNQGT